MGSMNSLKVAGIAGLLSLTLACTGKANPVPEAKSEPAAAPYTTPVQDGYALVSNPALTTGYSSDRAAAVRELAKLLLTQKQEGLVQTKERYWQRAEFFTELPKYQVNLTVLNANEAYPTWETSAGPRSAPADHLQIQVIPKDGGSPIYGVTHGLTGNWSNGGGMLSGTSRQAIDSVVNAVIAELKR